MSDIKGKARKFEANFGKIVITLKNNVRKESKVKLLTVITVLNIGSKKGKDVNKIQSAEMKLGKKY